MTVKRGWLSKREEVSGSLTTWRKRWFVLNEEELSWYKSDRDPLTGAGALGSVPVASIEEVKFAYLEKKYCFTIRTHDQIFGVHADDAEGRDAWLMTFSDLMLKAKSNAADAKRKRDELKRESGSEVKKDVPLDASEDKKEDSEHSSPTEEKIDTAVKEEIMASGPSSPTSSPVTESKILSELQSSGERKERAEKKVEKEAQPQETTSSSSLSHQSSSESLPVVKPRDDEKQKAEQYVFFEIRGRCPNCMQGIVINGAVRSLRCIFCESVIELRPDKLWDTLLARITHSDYGSLAKNGMINSTIGGGYLAGRSYVFNDNIMKEVSNPVDSVVSYLTIGHGFEKPKCASCKSPLDNVTSVASGEDRIVSCQTCGFNSLTFPLPKWMVDQNEERSKWQIFCATDKYDLEDEGMQDALEGNLLSAGKSAQELLMPCPKCQHAIDISLSKGYERIVSCDGCGANIVRPRVEPVRKARRWYIRYFY